MKHWAYIILMCLVFTGCNDRSDSITANILNDIIDNSPTGIINNDVIEVRLSNSGSIAYIAEIGGENLIDNQDLGRQIQPSFYAGEDQIHQDQHNEWSPWPWNIIQSGDVYGNESIIIDQIETDTTSITTVTPMLWDRINVPEDEAVITNDIELIANTIKVIVKLQLTNDCVIINPQPRHQEMPAIYTVGSLNNLISGDNIIKNSDNKWVYWSDEEWAGAFDDDGYGIAVYNPNTELFIGGRYESGADKTTYFSPLCTLTIKPGDEWEYTYWLIIGTIQEVKDAILGIQAGEVINNA
jgi:hypothetical protein